jgi:UDP-N-acetylglucosamine 3-dehydrogenase
MSSLMGERIEMTDRKINVAVLGAGYWGRKVLSEYLELEKANPNVRLVKVCDLLEDNLNYCRDKLHLEQERLSSDFNDLLQSDIDALHICTPQETHFMLGMQALNAHKHVLLEKPLAMATQEGWELCDTANKKRLCLQVGHIYRFNNAMQKLRDLISQKYFGRLYYLKMQWTTLMPSPLGRDIIFDLGPHPVDIMNFLLNQWPINVSCTSRVYRRKSLEEVAYIGMEFKDNVMAHVELSWLEPGKIRELKIMGEMRSAVVNCLDQTIQVFEENGNKSYSLTVKQNNTIYDEISHFVNSIIDRKNYRNPGIVGANNVAILQQIKRAAMQERTLPTGQGFRWAELQDIRC